MSDVLQHFQYLHTIPEPGMKEFKTSDYVASVLSREGYRIIRNLGGSTGIAGIWDSGIPGPVLGIRADMDALAHVIDGKTVYRHSCGHDGHMAMLLAAAERQTQTDFSACGRNRGRCAFYIGQRHNRRYGHPDRDAYPA